MRALLSIAFFSGCSLWVGDPLDKSMAMPGATPSEVPSKSSDPGPIDRDWKLEPSGVNVVLMAVWGSSATDVYAVGESGTILHSNGDGSWKTQAYDFPGPEYVSVWGASERDVYVGGTVVVHSAGDGRWQEVRAAKRANLWGSGGQDIYLADQGNVSRSSGDGKWEISYAASGNMDMRSVFGTGTGDVYALGDEYILRSGGDNLWAILYHSPTADLFHLWASSPQNYYVARLSRGVLHQRPQLSMIELADKSILSIFGSSAADVYAVGEGGQLYHTTGDGNWIDLTAHSATNQTLFAVWADHLGSAYAVGRNGTIVHRKP